MKKIIFYIFVVLLVLFVGALILRMCDMDSQSVLNKITPSENARAAYANGEKILTRQSEQNISYDGFMRCYAIVYLPERDELQVTVKYTNASYDKLGTTQTEGFGFKLYDTETAREFTDYTEERASDRNYGYYRLVFEGVEFSDKADLEVVMFPKRNEERYSAIKIHSSTGQFKDYKLSKEEIASLGGR